MKFKVGDRVRIVYRGWSYGKTATVYGIDDVRPWTDESVASGTPKDEIGYLVDVDGIGIRSPTNGHYLAYPSHDLRPLTDPNATKFIEEMNKAKETA
jgi:hypothetical protein